MIKGRKITLRAVEKDDIPKIWEWENNSEVMEFASSAPERCVSLAAMERMLTNQGPNGEGPRRYLILDENQQGIGLISYWVPNPRFSTSAELGIYLGQPDLWRQGYGTDAVMTLAYVLFMHLGFHRLGFATGGHNFRVQKVMEKFGVAVEGTIREERYMHGKYYDTIRLGLLKDEFVAAYDRWRGEAEQQEGEVHEASLSYA